MLYERRYSDEYLIKKYIRTSKKWYDMYLTAESYYKRYLKEIVPTDRFDDVDFPFDTYSCSGHDIGKTEVYKYCDPSDGMEHHIESVFRTLQFAFKQKKWAGIDNYFRDRYEKANNSPTGFQYADLFYDLDYLEYAYPIALSLSKKILRKASMPRFLFDLFS